MYADLHTRVLKQAWLHFYLEVSGNYASHRYNASSVANADLKSTVDDESPLEVHHGGAMLVPASGLPAGSQILRQTSEFIHTHFHLLPRPYWLFSMKGRNVERGIPPDN